LARRKLTINYKERTVTVPAVFSIPKPSCTYVYDDEESEKEYEYEELEKLSFIIQIFHLIKT
jgi:hypothetical protein